ncbi:MAG: isoprenylcysteine carboxylmethyltransferase family protein [Candidatus Bathyarchaeota archaeon]
MAPLDLILVGVGAAMALAGAAICLYWYFYWNRNFRGKLLTEGPYAYVRHPLYTGFTLLAFGLALAVPVYETRLLVVITMAVIVVFVPKEEEALLQKYKQKYREYMERVRHRLIPHVY